MPASASLRALPSIKPLLATMREATGFQLLFLAGSMSLDDAARLHERKRNTLLAGIYASRYSNGKRRCLEIGYSEEASPRAVLQGNFQRLCSVIAGCACGKLQFKRAYAIFSVSECGTC